MHPLLFKNQQIKCIEAIYKKLLEKEGSKYLGILGHTEGWKLREGKC